MSLYLVLEDYAGHVPGSRHENLSAGTLVDEAGGVDIALLLLNGCSIVRWEEWMRPVLEAFRVQEMAGTASDGNLVALFISFGMLDLHPPKQHE